MPNLYNHAMSISFEVLWTNADDPEEIPVEVIRLALARRLMSLASDEELKQSVDLYDTGGTECKTAKEGRAELERFYCERLSAELLNKAEVQLLHQCVEEENS